jgi:hypothetical protein
MQKARMVIYIDANSKEHEALVSAAKRHSSYRDRNGDKHELFTPLTHLETGADDCVVSGLYINPELAEADSVVRFYDVPHFTDPSRVEPNPALPSYQLNCWKDFYEEHTALPADHAHFDHPFHVEYETDNLGNPRTDSFGNKVKKMPARPEYDAHVDAHQAKPEVQAAMATAAAGPAASADVQDAITFLVRRGYSREDAAKAVSVTHADHVKLMAESTRAANAPVDQADGATGELPAAVKPWPVTETKHYTDGSSATGIAPLPDQSPEQQAEQEKQIQKLNADKEVLRAALDRPAAAAAYMDEQEKRIEKLMAENDQLHVAVDQGSEALFAKDAEIRKLKASAASAMANPGRTRRIIRVLKTKGRIVPIHRPV